MCFSFCTKVLWVLQPIMSEVLGIQKLSAKPQFLKNEKYFNLVTEPLLLACGRQHRSPCRKAP